MCQVRQWTTKMERQHTEMLQREAAAQELLKQTAAAQELLKQKAAAQVHHDRIMLLAAAAQELEGSNWQ